MSRAVKSVIAVANPKPDDAAAVQRQHYLDRAAAIAREIGAKP